MAARLGHADPAVTLRVYSHVLREHSSASETSSPEPSRLALANPLARRPAKEMRQRFGWSEVVVRGGVEPPTFRFSGGRSYQLSYLTWLATPADPAAAPPTRAVLTGFEPATSTLTGWRALRAALQDHAALAGASVPPTGFEPVPPP